MRKHRFDTVSFVGGVVALTLGIALFVGGRAEDQWSWALPLLIGVGGLIVIGKSIDRHRKTKAEL